MPGELLAKYFMQKLSQTHPEIQQQQETVEELVFKNPFHMTEEEIEQQKIKKEEDFRIMAEKITSKLNNPNKLQITEDF